MEANESNKDTQKSTNVFGIKVEGNNFSKNRRRQRYTHFLSVPLILSSTFQKNLDDFFSKVSKIDNKYLDFRYNMPLHITIAVLNLDEEATVLLSQAMDKKRVNISASFNHEILPKIGKPYTFVMDGIGYFGSPSNTFALFGEVEMFPFTNRLNNLANEMITMLLELGIIENYKDIPHAVFDKSKKQYSIEKFHVTLMKGSWKVGNFNSEAIIKELNDTNFGEIEISKIALIRMDSVHTEEFAVLL
jgi:2'-5' RNA ligase